MKSGHIVFMVLFGLLLFTAFDRAQAQPRLKITPDAELMVFEGPLLPDGRVDYITAMNRRDAERVRHEDNAFRALLLLFDESTLSEQSKSHFQSYCKLLGVTEQERAEAPKFLGWYDYAEQAGLDWEVAGEIEGGVLDGDFSHARIDVFKRWLNRYESALDAVMSACVRPSYWQPFLESASEPGSGVIELVPMAGYVRHFALGVYYRGLFALNQGDWKLVVRSALALQQLAAHHNQGPLVIDSIVGGIPMFYAQHLFNGLLKQKDVPHDTIDLLATQWMAAPAPVRYYKLHEAGEVVYSLNWCMGVAANQISLDDDRWMLELDDSRELENAIDRVGVDLNALVRRVRMYHDAQSVPLKADHYTQYKHLDEAYDKNWDPRKTAFRERYFVEEGDSLRFQLPDGDLDPAELAWVIVDLSSNLESEFEFDIDTGRIEFANLAKHAVGHTAAACARYYIRHSRYPAQLSDLVPAFLASVPLDPIDGKPLRYRLNPDGSAAVYSVFTDLDDDGGLTDQDDAEVIEDGDYAWQLKAF